MSKKNIALVVIAVVIVTSFVFAIYKGSTTTASSTTASSTPATPATPSVPQKLVDVLIVMEKKNGANIFRGVTLNLVDLPRTPAEMTDLSNFIYSQIERENPGIFDNVTIIDFYEYR